MLPSLALTLSTLLILLLQTIASVYSQLEVPFTNRANSQSYQPVNARQAATNRASLEQLWRHQQQLQHPQLKRSPEIVNSNLGSTLTTTTTITTTPNASSTSPTDICSDRLCYGLPMGCLDNLNTNNRLPSSSSSLSNQFNENGGQQSSSSSSSRCSVLVTSKHLIDPYKPVARDIHFELVAVPISGQGNYAAVGFSDNGRMSGLVSECLQYWDPKTKLHIITLAHSFNMPGVYQNVPAIIHSGIKNLGVSFENGYYQCRWVVESAVEFQYEDPINGQVVQKREDLGYKNYHILLASGQYNERMKSKAIHSDRVSSLAPISLAQTGHIKSLGSHILIRIHGSLMIAIWIGMVTISVLLARYFKNEWSQSKINDTAIWFVVHRALMLLAWFGTIIAIIFAYMYTESYHFGLHQISGTTCLILSTIQVIGGLLRPSLESSRRIYFNWTHFLCGNLSYLCAVMSIVTAAFLAPAHLPPIYLWVVVAFVTIYALTHFIMTVHQYIVHKSSSKYLIVQICI